MIEDIQLEFWHLHFLVLFVNVSNFVLIIFGGYSGYSGDDINKFIWMIRIAGGYYPRIKEDNYLKNGYRTDAGASETMLNSMMYKFSYYRFAEVRGRQQEGYDMVRGYVIGRKDIKLRHFKEAYTTQNWMVRIYSVNDYPNREIAVKSRFSSYKGDVVEFYPYVRLNMPKSF